MAELDVTSTHCVVLTKEHVDKMHKALKKVPEDWWIRLVSTLEYVDLRIDILLQGPDGEEETLDTVLHAEAFKDRS